MARFGSSPDGEVVHRGGGLAISRLGAGVVIVTGAVLVGLRLLKFALFHRP